MDGAESSLDTRNVSALSNASQPKISGVKSSEQDEDNKQEIFNTKIFTKVIE